MSLECILISIENIYYWTGTNLAQRRFIKGERVLNAGHIIEFEHLSTQRCKTLNFTF